VKVVIDTNVLVSGIFWNGAPSDVLDLWARDKITVVVSPAIIFEYERVLEEMDRKRPSGQADVWSLFIAQHSLLVHPSGPFRICRDPEDDKFLHCAVFSGAKFLVSGDKDLLTLKALSGLQIVSPAEFLKRL
jgi:uncharacterized protein